MARLSDKRLAVGILVAAVTAALVVAGVEVVARTGDKAIDRVDQATVRAQRPLSDVGPPLGTYERAWRRDVETTEIQDLVTVAGPHVVVATEHALQAYDVRTGRASWHYRETEEGTARELTGFAVTAGVVVATFADAGTTAHVVGLDAGTGEMLWDDDEAWTVTVGGDAFTPKPAQGDAAAGIVPMRDTDDETYGVTARTGEVRWRIDEDDVADEDDCTPREPDGVAAGDGAVLPVAVDCADGGEIQATVDARSGDLLWARRATPPTTEMRTAGPVAMLETSAGAVELVGRNGRTLKTFRSADDASLFSIADKVAVAYTAPSDIDRPDDTTTGETYTRQPTSDDDGHQDEVAIVDRETGATKRVVVRGTVVGPAWVAAGGRLYGITKSLRPADDTPMLPAGLAVVDVAAGRLDQAPLPYGGQDLRSRTLDTRALGAVDGRLLTVDQAADDRYGTRLSVLASYRVTDTKQPTELGGVPVDDWPDACRLLPSAGEPAVGKPKRVGRVTLEQTTCRNERASVRVLWVARTEAEAATLLEGGELSTVGADEQRQALGQDASILRVGRVVVQVDAAPSDVDPDGSARTVVRRLRAHQP